VECKAHRRGGGGGREEPEGAAAEDGGDAVAENHCWKVAKLWARTIMEKLSWNS